VAAVGGARGPELHRQPGAARGADDLTSVLALEPDEGVEPEAGDALLVGRARGGDKASFALLVERHRGMLLALCRRRLGEAGAGAGAGLAEDAAQEAILQAMLSLDRLRQPDRFGPWLAGIGLNVCRRWQRQRARECWSLEAVLGGQAAPAPAPDELFEAAEVSELVLRAVRSLPLGQRAAVVLFHLAGLPHREVAARLGVSVGAVKTRLHKGRAALRAALRAYEHGHKEGEGPAMIDMRLAEVRYRPAEGDQPEKYVLLLEEQEGEGRLPIWVGAFEATAIALALHSAESARPMTFQFAASLLDAAGGRLEEARITRLTEGVFYGVAVVAGPGGSRVVDARPSDLLNLALLTGAPIRVDQAVIEEAARSGRSVGLAEDAAAYPKGSEAIVAETMSRWQAQQEAIRREREGG
jgi:RNA polymerase sigma factor (sigma-70 family)